MAGRIPELSFESRGMDVDVEPDQTLTPDMVDAAVESVLEPYDEPTKERYRSAWASDETSEVARLLQTAVVSRSSRLKSYADISRRPVTIGYSLTTDEQLAVTRRYPEMELRFMPNKQHDHPLAAVDRLLSSIKLHSKMPEGMQYVDFGGSILMHVEQGNSNVCVVGGIHDVKDAARSTMVRMRLRKLSEDINSTAITREMASSVLNGEGKYFVDSSLQKFDRKCQAGVLSHVYDVPLLEIPQMMNRTGMLLFEGVIHFSSRFFFEEEGEMPGVGARFRIRDGQFQMGFVDSPSHWYGHEWEQFSCYGADQTLRVAGASYSYKVYENRGDTISFRILRVGSSIRDPGPQYVARPGVPMVMVNSYEHSNLSARVRGRLTALSRLYPKDVWERMTRAAMLDASRGELDFSKHFKSYRSIIAGHKYNAVSTVSDVVKTSDVPWLVVDSALYGLTQVTMLRRNTRAFVASELEKRVLAGSSALHLVLGSFAASVKGLLGGVSSPLVRLMERLAFGVEESVDKLVEASVQVRFIRIDGEALVRSGGKRALVEKTDFPLRELVRRNEVLDTYITSVLEAVKADESGQVKGTKSSIVVNGVDVEGSVVGTDQSGSTTLLGIDDDRPGWVPFVGDKDPVIKEEYFRSSASHTTEQRREAIRETVRAVEAEHREVEAWAAERFSKFAGGRVPDVEEVKRCSEENKNFDFWWVNKGVFKETSVSGASTSTFDYAGVFCPSNQTVVDVDGKAIVTRLVPVEDTVYEDVLKGTFRQYKSLTVDYTGLVLVSDSMKVLNGPHVSAGLKLATNQPVDMELAVMEGGPGCGKSFTILKSFRKGDMVLTPLRKSAEELRDKLVAAGVLTRRAAMRAVRTLDSLLVEAGKHGGFSGRALESAFMVHLDECFNVNAGRVYGPLALVNARRAMMYGDRLQINHVVRADIELLYGQVEAQHVVKRWTVFRSAAEVLATYNCHYGYKLRTANKSRGVVTIAKEFPVIDPKADVKCLVMNQATKLLVARKYAGQKLDLSTTHEAQGSEADTVILFNFETRKIGDDNPVYLYKQARYVNVALSRAKTTFIYVPLSEFSDTVKDWIEKGKSPALIQECRNLSTAGKSALLC